MIDQYNIIRNRLLLSAGTKETGLALPFINHTTLRLWLKQGTRRDEARVLLAGRHIPSPPLLALEPLLPANEKPHDQPQVAVQHLIVDPADTRNQGNIRCASHAMQQAADVPCTSEQAAQFTSAALESDFPPQATSVKSRQTDWRNRKRAAEGANMPLPRKTYTCGTCGKPMMTEGHTQFRGQRYCPQTPGILPQGEWLQQKRAEATAKKGT